MFFFALNNEILAITIVSVLKRSIVMRRGEECMDLVCILVAEIEINLVRRAYL